MKLLFGISLFAKSLKGLRNEKYQKEDHNPHEHLAWGATGSVSQTARNQLKLGARREGTV